MSATELTGHAAARPDHPQQFPHGLGPAVRRQIVDREAGQGQVERVVRERQLPHVAVEHLDPVRDAGGAVGAVWHGAHAVAPKAAGGTVPAGDEVGVCRASFPPRRAIVTGRCLT